VTVFTCCNLLLQVHSIDSDMVLLLERQDRQLTAVWHGDGHWL